MNMYCLGGQGRPFWPQRLPGLAQISICVFVFMCIVLEGKDDLSGLNVYQVSCKYACMYAFTISRLLKIIGLFCRISSLLQGSFATETYNFKEPTNRSHPIRTYVYICIVFKGYVDASGLNVCQVVCIYIYLYVISMHLYMHIYKGHASGLYVYKVLCINMYICMYVCAVQIYIYCP